MIGNINFRYYLKYNISGVQLYFLQTLQTPISRSKTVLSQDHELFTHKIIKIKYFGKMNTFCIYLYHLNFLAGNSICFKKSQFSKIRKLLREILQAFLAVKLNYGNKTPLTDFQFPKANFLRMFKPYHSSYLQSIWEQLPGIYIFLYLY